jgi:para-nitrobenzyl esterase
MTTYWANFIRKGNPNGIGLPEWPSYNTRDKRIMNFDQNSEAIPLPDHAALDFLNERMKTR